MNILKKLNLNSTPNTVENGSIVCAKNISIDDTGSFIINESGIASSFTPATVVERIIGCIPCNNEIVVFTCEYVNDTFDYNKCYIYRHSDLTNVSYRVNHHWTWSGGKLIGDFSYNYKNQLIIVLAEYDAPNNTKVPLKSWILPGNGEADSYIEYDIAPRIPFFTGDYIITNSDGSLLCGAYTFFIRFEIAEDTHTAWFQVTDEILINQLISKDIPVLNYFDNSHNIKHTPENAPDNIIFPEFKVNTDLISNKAIQVHVATDQIWNSDNSTKYTKCQLGYIFKRNAETVGRIIADCPIDTDGHIYYTVADNNYIEEEGIDEFFYSPKAFYNVKSLKVYNNRVYIANYEEDSEENFNTENVIVAGVKTASPIDLYSGDASSSDSNTGEDTEFDPDYDPEQYSNRVNTTFELCFDEPIRYTEKNTELNVDPTTKNATYVINNNPGAASAAIFKNLLSEVLVKTSTGTDTINAKNKSNFPLSNIPVYDKKTDTYGFNDTTGVVHYFDVRLKQEGSNHFVNIVTLSLNKDTIGYSINDQIRIEIIYDSTSNDYKLLRITDETSRAIINISATKDVTPKTNLIITEARLDTNSSLGRFYGVNANKECIGYKNFALGSSYINLQTDSDAQRTRNDFTYHLGTNFVYNIPVTATPVYIASTRSSRTNAPANSTNFSYVNDSMINYFNHTLLPYQYYKFYIHFIRKNGTVTDGYLITNSSGNTRLVPILNDDSENFICFKVVPQSGDYKLYYPVFTCNLSSLPDNCIGYFFTYEQIEQKVIPIVVTKAYASTGNVLSSHEVNSSSYLYDIDSIHGKYINDDTTNDITNITFRDSNVRERNATISISSDKQLVTRETYLLTTNNKNVYNKQIKTLYRLTPNYNIINAAANDRNFMYLPSFYCREIIIYYEADIIGSINTDTFYDGNLDSVDLTAVAPSIKLFNKYNYSNYPYFMLAIKQDYEEAIVNFVDTSVDPIAEKGIRYNRAVMPKNVKHFLELKAAYTGTPLIVYTNYKKSYTNLFPITIFRSDVLGDEKLTNSFIKFHHTNYRNIFENKGSIINIVSQSLLFLVHTEYGLFVFDRSPKLNKKFTFDIPDTFDIDYQQIITKSYGGLKKREHSIVCNFGYIWYDFVNKTIFRFDDNNLAILSTSIENFISELDITDVRFAVENKHNRLIICFYINFDGSIYPLTISYNFNTGTFISLHDYHFTQCYITSETEYIYDDTDNKVLYKYVESATDYSDLENKVSLYYPMIYTDKPHRYVDIIFNAAYENSKVLDAICFILKKYNTSSTIDKTNINLDSIVGVLENAGSNNYELYSGDKMLIYTDECNSGYLDISKEEIINKIEDYKKPHYDKGRWFLNWFRNRITTPVTEEELETYTSVLYYNAISRKTIEERISINKLNRLYDYNESKNKANSSDNRSLIYGKYFVVRFVFDYKNKIKLETIDFNIQNY